MIKMLTINEIEPVTDDTPVVNYSTVFTGNELKAEVHEFFKKHVDNIYENPKTRNGRFINKVSTILNSIGKILNNEIEIEDANFIFPDDLNENHKNFYYNSKIIVDLLAKNISKNVKNPFLFVVLLLEHDELGDLIAFLKMDSHFGIQFSKSELVVHLNMLPDKERDLQKCALVFKNQLDTIPIDSTFNSGDFHTKILDKQDIAISQYFMTSFLDNNVITNDKENTKLASKHITSVMLRFANEGVSRPQIKTYIENIFQNRNVTSIESIVEDLINNSNLINKGTVKNLNFDSASLRKVVYNNMLNENKSAQQTFTAEPDFVEKRVIKDKTSAGKDLKFHVAEVMISKGVVKYDYEEENGLNKNDWMKIAIKRDIIDTEDKENPTIDNNNDNKVLLTHSTESTKELELSNK